MSTPRCCVDPRAYPIALRKSIGTRRPSKASIVEAASDQGPQGEFNLEGPSFEFKTQYTPEAPCRHLPPVHSHVDQGCFPVKNGLDIAA